jgi:hypothetical protein
MARVRDVKWWVLLIAISCGSWATPTFAQTTTHGMTIPSGHPRLWFNAARLATARAWFQSRPFSASDHAMHDFHREQALECLLGQNATVCNAAVTWAMSVSLPTSGVSCDQCRWSGEAAILTFDWCYNFFSPGQRSTFLSNWNSWLGFWKDQSWGGNRLRAYRGVPMYGNNYYWGYLRNQVLWGIATAGENPMADSFLADALTTRWTEEFIPAAASITPPFTSSHKGGALPEGDQYGIYLAEYPSIGFISAQLYGRNIYGESNFFNEAAFNIIYSTTLAPTAHGAAAAGYEVYPFNDSDNWRNGSSATGSHYVDFMGTMIAANPSSNLAKWAQQWLNLKTNSIRSPHISSTDPGVSPLAFSSLPLDYFVPGMGFFYGKNAWSSGATAFLWMLGQHGVTTGTDAATVGHRHDEIGSFQIWRNGKWLARNDTSYGEQAAGDPSGLLGANTIMIGGTNVRYNRGRWTVRRMESTPTYSYANTDFTTVYGTVASAVQRELVFVRSLETTVVLDRINTAGTTTKTWLAHFENNPTLQDANHVNHVNGSEALRVTTLVPANATRRVVAEGGAIGQYRLEIDTTGTQSYFLTVLQAKDANGAELNPTVVDNGSTFEVTLNGSVSMSFNKGASSAGGSITIAGAARNFRGDVQNLVVSPAGPVWDGTSAPPGVSLPAAPQGVRIIR